MIGDEFKEIVVNGEFSEALDLIFGDGENTQFTFGDTILSFGDAQMGIYTRFPIHGFVKRGWKRSEIDGVLTTEFPREAITFTISEDSLPSIALNGNKLSNITFEYKNTLWEVVYVIGIDLLSFMVIPKDDLETEDDDWEDEIETTIEDAPGLI